MYRNVSSQSIVLYGGNAIVYLQRLAPLELATFFCNRISSQTAALQIIPRWCESNSTKKACIERQGRNNMKEQKPVHPRYRRMRAH